MILGLSLLTVKYQWYISSQMLSEQSDRIDTEVDIILDILKQQQRLW